MRTPEEIYEMLKNQFSDSILEFESELPVEKFINVSPSQIHSVSKYLKDHLDLQFDCLMCLSGTDDNNDEKTTDEDGNETVVPGTLSVYYNLHSIKYNHKVNLRVKVQKDKPEVESVENIWKTANWHEREAFDMIGIKFLNHPDLRRILMPEDWEEGSHPLRKDYENPEFYQGMKVPY
ncbi:MAG: NADH-quinone oxidoreductase subunit C [Melioribacteraceae bacterium]|nr:NADH-quinone oxidoreductase subunit C [Melioribacteraceae bacterium]MCF8265371.1 NADH-quinone oxidoreductase subunit C [Melioribacteraceae bacterium]MCF8412289.1 NADH-quinone oxidoreductase subunit C [Melioribacteraceae bacterium]